MMMFFIITVILLLIYTYVGVKIYNESCLFSKHIVWNWLPMAIYCWILRKKLPSRTGVFCKELA